MSKSKEGVFGKIGRTIQEDYTRFRRGIITPSMKERLSAAHSRHVKTAKALREWRFSAALGHHGMYWANLAALDTIGLKNLFLTLLTGGPRK